MGEVKTHKVTLYNDDVLGFEYVTACLIKVCKHTPIQAEQLEQYESNLHR